MHTCVRWESAQKRVLSFIVGSLKHVSKSACKMEVQEIDERISQRLHAVSFGCYPDTPRLCPNPLDRGGNDTLSGITT